MLVGASSTKERVFTDHPPFLPRMLRLVVRAPTFVGMRFPEASHTTHRQSSIESRIHYDSTCTQFASTHFESAFGKKPGGCLAGKRKEEIRLERVCFLEKLTNLC